MTRSPHPLDPITADEITRAVRIALAAPELSDRVKVVSVEAREPVKEMYLAWKAGGPRPAREAFCVLLDNGRRRGVEVVVSLDDETLVSAADLADGGCRAARRWPGGRGGRRPPSSQGTNP